MQVYILTLLIVCILGFMYEYFLSVRNNKSLMLCILIAAVLIFVSGFRYKVGTDYATYMNSYSSYKNNSFSFLEQPGLTVIAKISGFIYDDYATWFFIMALITISLAVYGIRKYSISFSFSVLLYIFLGCWHGSFNIVKQSMAAAIVFCGIDFLKNRELFKWCILCLLATMFHVSALLLIPLYFLITPKFSKSRIILFVIMGVAVYLFGSILFDVMKSLKSSGITSADSAVGSRQVNRLRIIVNIMPFIIWLFTRNYYDYKDKQFVTILNMSILNAILSVATMNSVYLTRFLVYTSIFDVLFIPYLMKPFTKNTKIVFFIIMFAMYAVFWLYDLNKSSATNVFQWVFNR